MLEDRKRWRLLRDFKKGKFCFLIGIDHWSIELQKSEFESLYFLLLRINKQLIGIKNELMESLRFVFESQDETRSFEMYWPIPIAQTLFYEIKNMWESMN